MAVVRVPASAAPTMQQHGFTSETALDVLANVPVPTTVVLAAKHEVGSAATSCSGSFTVEVVGAR